MLAYCRSPPTPPAIPAEDPSSSAALSGLSKLGSFSTGASARNVMTAGMSKASKINISAVTETSVVPRPAPRPRPDSSHGDPDVGESKGVGVPRSASIMSNVSIDLIPVEDLDHDLGLPVESLHEQHQQQEHRDSAPAAATATPIHAHTALAGNMHGNKASGSLASAMFGTAVDTPPDLPASSSDAPALIASIFGGIAAHDAAGAAGVGVNLSGHLSEQGPRQKPQPQQKKHAAQSSSKKKTVSAANGDAAGARETANGGKKGSVGDIMSVASAASRRATVSSEGLSFAPTPLWTPAAPFSAVPSSWWCSSTSNIAAPQPQFILVQALEVVVVVVLPTAPAALVHIPLLVVQVRPKPQVWEQHGRTTPCPLPSANPPCCPKPSLPHATTVLRFPSAPSAGLAPSATEYPKPALGTKPW